MNAASEREWEGKGEPYVRPVTIPTASISAALAKAQCEMHNPKFDTSNPFFKNRYASLAAVRDAVIPVLAKHGIALTQDITRSEHGISCMLTLRHSSGECLTFGPLDMPASKHDTQGLGSCATYARRYQLMAVCGVVGDDDDDGEVAVGRGDGPKNLPKIDPRGEEPAQEDQEKARAAADKCRAALKVGIDEAIWEMHDDLNKNQSFYIAVSAFLTAPERREWKEIMKRRFPDAGKAAK